jgi:hypothetical protein
MATGKALDHHQTTRESHAPLDFRHAAHFRG